MRPVMLYRQPDHASGCGGWARPYGELTIDATQRAWLTLEANPIAHYGQLAGESMREDTRTVAAKFVVSAMTRENLALSWSLTHPKLKAGYTRKEWLTGNIPVPVFPSNAFAGASYKVQWSHPNDLLLNVYVFAKPKMARLSNAFFIELNPVGTGASKRWLVSYVAPSGGGQNVPVLGSGG